MECGNLFKVIGVDRWRTFLYSLRNCKLIICEYRILSSFIGMLYKVDKLRLKLSKL